MSAPSYFLNASLFLLLFYSCYWLLLRRTTFFALNRAYLLLSVVLSLLLPWIDLPDHAAESLPIGTLTLPAFDVDQTATRRTDDVTTAQWLWLLYGLGVSVMLLRLIVNLVAVLRLVKKGRREAYRHYTLVCLPSDSTPSFSFGHYLVLNQSDAGSQPETLIRHEEAHIRQRHTCDVLFIELVRAGLWFNPVLWLYKRSLQEVHEFLADRAVLKTPQPDYARQLVAYALNVPSTALTTPFASVSTLKQRIVMLQKPQSNRWALLGYALVLPLATLLVMCTQPDQAVTEGKRPAFHQPLRQAGIDGEVFTVVEQQPEFTGGMSKLGNFLMQNLRYPKAAQRAQAQGKVFVRFIVTKEGEVKDVTILKGIGFGADEEAVRVVSLMPRWKPGMQNGRAVNTQFNLPINFTLNDPANQTNEAIVPPPPPPFPDGQAQLKSLNQVKFFTINGKTATKAQVDVIPADKIKRVEVFSDKQAVAVTMK
ncbi:M56 family metallopeptidase [Spirosoma fluminis]